MSLEQAVLLFAVFAFAGWLLEVAYRSWLQKRFVNAGFLHGPFLPIYGLGALFVLGCDALLHDFFLYDWRHHDLPELAREKIHGLEPPRIALANAERLFAVNARERDIILKHMWPLTWRPPRFKESLVVCLVDKLVSLAEYRARWKS